MDSDKYKYMTIIILRKRITTSSLKKTKEKDKETYQERKEK